MIKKYKTIPILIISLAFLITGCNKRPVNNNTDINQPLDNATSSNSKQQTASTSADKNKIDTSDWLVYRNEEYGIEFKYQPYWKTAATDVGINEENKDYLLDMLVLNRKNGKDINILQMQIIDLNGYKENDMPDFIEKYLADNIEGDIYYKKTYFGNNFYFFYYKDNIEFKIRVGNIKNKSEGLLILKDILNTLTIK